MKIKHILPALCMALSLIACNDDDVDIYTSPIVTDVTTGDATVTATTATVTGSVKDLSSQSDAAYTVGAVYSTSADDLQSSGTKVTGEYADGSVTTSLTGLQSGVTYYYATYVTLQGQMTYYGETKSFYTTDSSVGTPQAASITMSTAILGGTLNGVGDMIQDGSLEYGVALADTEAHLTTDYALLTTAEGTSNAFTVSVSQLLPATTYYYVAYMVLNGEKVYGNVQSFTTAALNYVVTDDRDTTPNGFVDMGTDEWWSAYDLGSDAVNAQGGLYGYGDQMKGLCRTTYTSDYDNSDLTASATSLAAISGMGNIPSRDQWIALLEVCDVENAEVNGVAGVKLTSTVTGNSLFFPAAGMRKGATVSQEGALVAYWTGTPYEGDSSYAWAVYVGSSSPTPNAITTGLAIRTVIAKPAEAEPEPEPEPEPEGDYIATLTYFNQSWGFFSSPSTGVYEGTYTLTITGADTDPQGVYLDIPGLLGDHPNCDITITDIKIDGVSIEFDDTIMERCAGDDPTTARRYIVNPWSGDAGSAQYQAAFAHNESVAVTINIVYDNGTPFTE
ncbi:MAG: DUF1566 domain-containing protein [Bacteroidales bacterium]|nr:DUF1566 domain-containing protein [Bacteroidales bacterium]